MIIFRQLEETFNLASGYQNTSDELAATIDAQTQELATRGSRIESLQKYAFLFFYYFL